MHALAVFHVVVVICYDALCDATTPERATACFPLMACRDASDFCFDAAGDFIPVMMTAIGDSLVPAGPFPHSIHPKSDRIIACTHKTVPNSRVIVP